MKIVGFGACMIQGTPFAREESFFERAIAKVKLGCEGPVETEIVALGGFTAPRVVRYLNDKVLAKKPAIVVLQFGATDTAIPLRKRLGSLSGTSLSKASTQISGDPANGFNRLRWCVNGWVSELLSLQPVTEKRLYLDSIHSMVAQAQSAGARIVVISPFVSGYCRSNRYAKDYTRALQRELPSDAGVHLLDAHTELSQHPKRKVLCRDGFHLSQLGHELIASRLAPLLQALIAPATLPSPGPAART